MYHANCFEIIKSDPLPVYSYQALVEPKPTNRPQLYQILGILAKKLMFEERKPVVSVEGLIEVLPDPINGSLTHNVKIPEVGNFNICLSQLKYSAISIDQFENYTHLINRLADIALTVYSNEYYKFHPKAPFILRDEPYFDKSLIEKTGILDSKSYYRGVMTLGSKNAFVLNRETQLRSYKNLLVELKSIKKIFEEKNEIETEIDFYNPPSDFIDYANFLLKGKAADVARSSYPGPSIKRIAGITWKYRAGNQIPGLNGTPADYLKNTYGITDLDLKQPLVVYELENGVIQYHVPQVLSVGHTFEDLAKRIPPWQRTQVWGSIHPDCKNQLHKIYDLMNEIDRTLRQHIPEVYPKLLEISTDSIDVSSLVSEPMEIELAFGNKSIKVKPPYDINFYHNYSQKEVSFARPVESPKVLVCVEKVTAKIEKFLDELSSEYELRNNSKLCFSYGSTDPQKNSYKECDMVLTIGGEDEEAYSWYKQVLQNEMGIPHQHITLGNAEESSVMQIILQMNLKLGGEPWVLPKAESIPFTIAINTYLNPLTGKRYFFVMVLDGQGHVLELHDPIEEAKIQDAVTLLNKISEKYERILFITSYDRFEILSQVEKKLSETGKEYCMMQIIDNSSFRFFETYRPKKAPRFGRVQPELTACPMEAYETAPQGRILKCMDNDFYLLTGKTIEKDALKRGCPTPIELRITASKGNDWNMQQLVQYVLSLCMMGRASGHMTRFPMPLYYLQLFGYYVNKFGKPKNETIKQKIFYV
jgi:hypothetical protein